MKKYMLVGIILLIGNIFLSAETKTLKCNSAIVNLTFKNVKVKKIKFINDNDIKYESISDSFDVKSRVSKENITFESSKKRAKISLYLPKGKSYKTHLKDKSVCSFDYQSIIANMKTGEKIMIKDGTVKVSDENGNQVLNIGDGGIYINDDEDTIRINKNGLYIKSDDELKDYSGFWAKLLAKTITGIADIAMNTSLKDIGKNVTKIINEQNFRVVGNKINSISSKFDTDKYGKMIKKKFNIKKNTKLNIETFNGDVTVNSTDSTLMKINIIITSPKEKDLENIKLNIKDEDNEINVRVYKAKQLIKGGADIVVSLPKNVSLRDIETSNGKIIVINSQGKLNAISSNGKIDVKNFDGNVALLTSNAKIKVKNISGKANLVSSNGDIKGENINKVVNVKTSNSDIELKQIKIAGDVKSSNANIILSTNNFYNHSEVKTSNGSITLSIPENINLNLKAKTSNALIKVNNLTIKSLKSSQNSLSGILGNGSKNVQLVTSNSKIIINKKWRSK